MIVVERSTFIHRPAEEVFAFIADKANLPLWASGIIRVQQTSAGPKATGTTFTIVAKVPGGTVETAYTYTSYELNKSFTGTGQGGPMVFNDAYQFEPRDNGTGVTMRLEISPRGVLQLLQPLLHLMVSSTTQKELAKAKTVLEERAA